jgi:hypothetical protein
VQTTDGFRWITKKENSKYPLELVLPSWIYLNTAFDSYYLYFASHNSTNDTIVY